MTSQTTPLTQALRQARREIHMYRQGREWIVSLWDQSVRAWRLSREQSYGDAVIQVREWRVDRAAELLGHDLDSDEHLTCGPCQALSQMMFHGGYTVADATAVLRTMR